MAVTSERPVEITRTAGVANPRRTQVDAQGRPVSAEAASRRN